MTQRRLVGDGKYCLTACQDKSIRLWNPLRPDPVNETSALLIKEYSGPHGYEVSDVASSKDNTKLASCGGDRSAFIWDVASGRVIRRLMGHRERINAINFAAHDQLVVTGSYDSTLRIWDLRSQNRKEIDISKVCRDSVTDIKVLDEESHILASSVDGCLRTFDVATGMIYEDDAKEPIASIALSHDKNCVAATCLDGTIRLLDRYEGVVLNVYKGHVHKDFTVDVGFSHTDGEIISGSEDGKIFVWNLVDAKIKAGWKAHTGVVSGLAVHPSKYCIISSSYDGTAKVWIEEESA